MSREHLKPSYLLLIDMLKVIRACLKFDNVDKKMQTCQYIWTVLNYVNIT